MEEEEQRVGDEREFDHRGCIWESFFCFFILREGGGTDVQHGAMIRVQYIGLWIDESWGLLLHRYMYTGWVLLLIVSSSVDTVVASLL